MYFCITSTNLQTPVLDSLTNYSTNWLHLRDCLVLNIQNDCFFTCKRQRLTSQKITSETSVPLNWDESDLWHSSRREYTQTPNRLAIHIMASNESQLCHKVYHKTVTNLESVSQTVSQKCVPKLCRNHDTVVKKKDSWSTNRSGRSKK